MMTEMITSAATTKQARQIGKLVEDCIYGFVPEKLTKDEAQHIIENGGALGEEIKQLLLKMKKPFIEEPIAKEVNNDEYADEEVKSNYEYLSGYKIGVDDHDRQTSVLQQKFPGLGGVDPEYLKKIKSGEIKLGKEEEKFVQIPNWIVRPDLFGTNYNEALEKALEVLNTSLDGKFYNYRKGELGSKRLRQTERSIAFWKKISEEQNNADLLIIPIQFGFKHRGRSVRRARIMFDKQEFGLGAFHVAVLLLTHPERLQHYDDLYIDCAGDEYSPDADGVFSGAPVFDFGDGRVEFDTGGVDDASDFYGSASAFAPSN